uniref:ribosomal-processing cysteine protease Prp n=1 Tax=Agathobacter sp. TaxID=2021311 RepID=UPI004055D19D
MIEITIFQNQNHEVTGFLCGGHAGYSEHGKDVICAGVSALVVNAINSIETFTSCPFTLDVEEETGLIDFSFTEEISQDAALLVDSMILGLQGIQTNYGNEYIILNFKEV